jgi:hypothetical protein
MHREMLRACAYSAIHIDVKIGMSGGAPVYP